MSSTESVFMSEHWVREIHETCSLAVAFETLKGGVEKDVTARQEIRNEGSQADKGPMFRFSTNGDSFLAVIEGTHLHRAVKFALTKGVIAVFDNDKPILEGVVVLGDDGVCRLDVKGERLDFWQFRKRALEDLFFRS